MLAGEAVILIPKEQPLLCQLHFSLWEDRDWEARGCFLFAFFSSPLTSEAGKLAVMCQQSQ